MITVNRETTGKLAFVVVTALAVVLIPPSLSAADTNVRPVWDFNSGIQNQLGGYYNKFERSPSRSSTFLSDTVYRGGGGRSLRVSANREAAGFCGVWMHLFDFRAEPRKYLDARDYVMLSFWVRGESGGEEFVVKLADKRWIDLEDSLAIGDVSRFLGGPVTTAWQEVQVPLILAGQLDLSRLGGLTLDFTTPGDHVVFIDDVCLKTRSGQQETMAETPVTTDKGSTAPFQPRPQAMWIWNTRPLLENAADRKQLFDFCNTNNVDEVWLQLLYILHGADDLFGPPQPADALKNIHCELTDIAKLQGFIREAHARNVRVHALDGYPEYAQKEYHPAPLAIVDGVIEYNRNAEPTERFDGIHFDNEPYLIIGWADPSRRKRILSEFLTLNKMCVERVHDHSDMEFGIDIPFWWDSRDDVTGEITGEVAFGGKIQPASYHCVDILDNVGIMNYRDTADGADGMYAHGNQLLAYADRGKKTKIYMGVETFMYEPTDVWFVLGLPRAQFYEALDKKGHDYSYLSRIDGFRTQMLDDGGNIHLGIELPREPNDDVKQRITRVMLEIAQRFGASQYPGIRENADRIYMDVRRRVGTHPEWTRIRARDINDDASGTTYRGFMADSIMLSKITFADNPVGDLTLQTQAAERMFTDYGSYHGLAIHYYDTYRKLLEPSTAKP